MPRVTGSIALLVLLVILVPAAAGQRPHRQPLAADPLVYHQITAFAEGSGGVGQPVLSGDGTTIAFAIAATTAGAPNRISTIALDGAGLTEVDAYQPACACGSWVDISADGTTVVSSDSMQLRLVDTGGDARTLVDLTSNELSSIRLTAAGDRVYFLLARDTAPVGSSTPLQRGIYVVEARGGPPRQVVGPDQIAALLALTPDAIQMLRLSMNGVDVSADGTRLVFGVYAGAQQVVLAINADGSNLHQLHEFVEFVQRVAIAGDGSRVAMDVIPVDPATDANAVSTVPFGGGEPETLLTNVNSGFDQPLQLSADGAHLLISPHSYLVDTATGTVRQLAALTPGADGHTALLTDGMQRAFMDAEARRFVYVMRTTRCADCPNLQEQLATLEIGPGDPGNAPTIAGATIAPTEIPLNFVAGATVAATIDPANAVVAAGVVALRDGRYDINVARDGVLSDDGQHGDATAGDGTYTNDAIGHVGAEARENDTGVRTIRFQAEVEGSDGRLHARALDGGTLTVVAAASP